MAAGNMKPSPLLPNWRIEGLSSNWPLPPVKDLRHRTLILCSSGWSRMHLLPETVWWAVRKNER